MTKPKHDIFLSYSSKDANRVKPIVELLEAQGWQVWWDPKIPHGTRFDAYIEEQLNQSKLVVVVWSKHSVNSKWVRAEASEGDSRDVLFPIKIDEVKPPLIFRAFQTTNLVNWKGEENNREVLELLSSIKNKMPTQNFQETDVLPSKKKVIPEKEEKLAESKTKQSQSIVKPPAKIYKPTAEESKPKLDKRLGLIILLMLITIGTVTYNQFFRDNSSKLPPPMDVPSVVVPPTEKPIDTVKIDNQIWMAKNLDIEVEGSFCYDNKPENCKKYGRLYTWEAARKACPKGWHLPTDEEWRTLLTAKGGYYDWTKPKSFGDPNKSYQVLIEGGKGNFFALFGGLRRSDGEFDILSKDGNYWSATARDDDDAWFYNFSKGDGAVNRGRDSKEWAFSCRCLQD